MAGMLSVQGICKTYGPVRALSQVSAEFRPGEVHAVLGENGAGKSTLMGVLAGFVAPDAGAAALDGRPLPFGKPFAIRELGIRMVHQHFMLVPHLTVLENLALAQAAGGLGPVPAGQIGESARQKAKELGWVIDLDALAGELPVGAQQRVEILKALSGQSDVLILDEPTAVLSPDEAEELFAVLRRLKADGRSVILIAHKLSEVMSVADRVTVLRKGAVVASCPISETNPNQLAEWMVGGLPPQGEAATSKSWGEAAAGAESVRIRDDRGALVVDGATVSVRRGEILGIGGVDGNGQVELAECLAGVRKPESGTVMRPPRTAYIPQDRQSDGLAMALSIEENLLIGGVPQVVCAGPFLLPGRVRAHAEALVSEFQVKAGSPADPVSSLSGGNQQKVVVARTLGRQPDFVVAVNPTRGLDIKATSYVHSRLKEAAARGAAVILFSTDLEELAEVADSCQFMSRGVLGGQYLGEAT